MIKKTKYYDAENESFIMGARLDCQLSNAWAHGFNGINAVNKLLNAPLSTQPDERFTITVRMVLNYIHYICAYISQFCDKVFEQNSKANWPYTARELARLDLEQNLNRLHKLSPLMFTTFTHEVSFLTNRN